jgi:hypothetical protein
MELLELTGMATDPMHEGNSLVLLLKDPRADWAHMVRTSFGPGNYTIVSEGYRYIAYNDGEEEFYNHSKDPYEWENVVADTVYQTLIEEYRKYVPIERYQVLEKNATGHLSYETSKKKYIKYKLYLNLAYLR